MGKNSHIRIFFFYLSLLFISFFSLTFFITTTHASPGSSCYDDSDCTPWYSPDNYCDGNNVVNNVFDGGLCDWQYDPPICAYGSNHHATHASNCAYGCSNGSCNLPPTCSNPYGTDGETRYDCSPATASSCDSNACVGLPQRCQNGTWITTNSSGECTTACNNCTHSACSEGSIVRNECISCNTSQQICKHADCSEYICIGSQGDGACSTWCGTPKYRCNGTSCIRDDTSGSFTTSNCNSSCAGATGTPPPAGTAPNPIVSCNPSPTSANDRFIISWTNNGNPVTYADIAAPNGFTNNSFYNKPVEGNAYAGANTTAPGGFCLNPYTLPCTIFKNPFSPVTGITYSVRLFNGVAQTQPAGYGTFNGSSCPYNPPTPTPTATPTPTLIPTPGAPTGLTATCIGSTITLNWNNNTPNIYNEASFIYHVDAALPSWGGNEIFWRSSCGTIQSGDSCSWIPNIPPYHPFSFTTSVAPNTIFRWEVQGSGAGGLGLFSQGPNFICPIPNKPFILTNGGDVHVNQ